MTNNKEALQELYELIPNDVIAQKILKKRARAIAHKPEIAVEDVHPNICICARFGSNDKFGIPYDNAIEICRNQHITPLPHAPSFISGITNWRGKLISVISLARLFGISDDYEAISGNIIIISDKENVVALVASEIIESKEYDKLHLKSALPMKDAIDSKFIIGIADSVISILDINKILENVREKVNQWRTT